MSDEQWVMSDEWWVTEIEWWVMKKINPNKALMSKMQIGRLSEEEYLLRYNKYSSNMYSNDQSDLPWSSSDRDVHHEHTRRREIQKYLRESCYHRIECTADIFLTAYMWRRPLNSVTLATTTHRKPKRVSNGTDTQIRAPIINKCRIKMVQKELYNVRDPPWGRDRKNREITL